MSTREALNVDSGLSVNDFFIGEVVEIDQIAGGGYAVVVGESRTRDCLRLKKNGLEIRKNVKYLYKVDSRAGSEERF